jgi:hypothetical protein
MKVQFQTSGGIAYFPGLAKPVTIDTAQAPQDADMLARQLADADFFNLPSVANSPAPRSFDAQTYTITIDDGQRRHTVQVSEPITDPNLRALVDHLRLLAMQTLRAQAGSSSAAPGERSLEATPAPAPPKKPRARKKPPKHDNGD